MTSRKLGPVLDRLRVVRDWLRSKEPDDLADDRVDRAVAVLLCVLQETGDWLSPIDPDALAVAAQADAQAVNLLFRRKLIQRFDGAFVLARPRDLLRFQRWERGRP